MFSSNRLMKNARAAPDRAASVATQMGTSRSWHQGQPRSGCAVTCKKSLPLWRAWTNGDMGGRRRGSPQRANGRA